RRTALHHPGGAQGFRVDDADGSSFAYLTDNELAPPGSDSDATDALARFASGVNVLVHDTQYMEHEMDDKRGWGHSSLESVLELGEKAEAPHLVLFHHDPDRDDAALDSIAKRAQAHLAARKRDTKATVAHEGLVIHLEGGRETSAAFAPTPLAPPVIRR